MEMNNVKDFPHLSSIIMFVSLKEMKYNLVLHGVCFKR